MSFLRPTVVLVATHWTPTFENCRRSLHLNGFDYQVLGWGENWQGWKWRAKQYIDYLETQSPHSLVVLLDAYDSIVTRHVQDFAHTFEAFQRPVVIGCEWWCGSQSNCGTVKKWWTENRIKPAFRSKVNAGCIVGYAGVLLQMYKWIFDHEYEDDQRGLADWVDLNGTKTVALDSGSALIYNGHAFDGLKGSKTAFFQHFPGPLFKQGLMPIYNSVVRKTLGTFARPIYPSEILTVCLWICLIFIVYSAKSLVLLLRSS